MSEVVEVKSEVIEEIAPEQAAISIDVEAGKPSKIDFSKAPKSDGNELMSAVILFVNRNDTGDKGPLTLKVEYKDVENMDDPDHSPIITKNETVATFDEGDYEQRETQYTFTDQNEPTFSVEGSGSCTVVGFFSPLCDEEEEEEEEEEANEKEDKKEE